MRKTGRVNVLLLLGLLIMWNVFLLSHIEDSIRRMNCFPYQTAFEQFVRQDLTEPELETFWQASEGNIEQFCELLTMYYGMDNNPNPAILKRELPYVKENQPENFGNIYEKVLDVWKDAACFPVGAIQNMPDAAVAYENSWNYARSFGGERVHEGTDVMATVNQRGIYPIYSISDGVIEKIGWLTLGGYRIGIRSPNGAYYYYAHRSEYAKEFQIGEEVSAGTFLGFMGDTGYSETPGTTGQFDVHLHFGVYLSDENGNEYAVNSYPLLKFLENHGMRR